MLVQSWESICTEERPILPKVAAPPESLFETNEDGQRIPSQVFRSLLIVNYLIGGGEDGNRAVKSAAADIAAIMRRPGYRQANEPERWSEPAIRQVLYGCNLTTRDCRPVVDPYRRMALVACVNQRNEKESGRPSRIRTSDFFDRDVSGMSAAGELLEVLIGGRNGSGAPEPAIVSASRPEENDSAWNFDLVARVAFVENDDRRQLLDEVEDEFRDPKMGGVIVVCHEQYGHGLTAFGTALAQRLSQIDEREPPLLLPVQRHRAHAIKSEKPDYKTHNTIEILSILRRYLKHGLARAHEMEFEPVREDDDIGRVIQEMQHLLASAKFPKTIILDGIHVQEDEKNDHDAADGRRLRRAIADDIVGTIVEGLMRPPFAGIPIERERVPEEGQGDNPSKGRELAGSGRRADGSRSADDRDELRIPPAVAPVDLAVWAANRIVILASSKPHWTKACPRLAVRPELSVEVPKLDRWETWSLPDWTPTKDNAETILEAQRLSATEAVSRLWEKHSDMQNFGSDSVLAIVDACCQLPGWNTKREEGLISLWPTEKAPPLDKVVEKLLFMLQDEGRQPLLQLLILLSMTPDGIRPDTLRRFVLRSLDMPARDRPLPALRHLVLEPDGSVASPAVLTKTIAGFDALLTASRNDSFAPFDADPHPLELGPDRSHAWTIDRRTSIDIGLPDVKYEIRKLVGQYIDTFSEIDNGEAREDPWPGRAPRAWHITHRLLAEDALQQMTASLRMHGAPPKRAIRSWRRMFSLFYHGLLSLPIQLIKRKEGLEGDLLSLEISCPDLFSPAESTKYYTWLNDFAYGRILEAPPLYRLTRQLGQDRLKEELAALFLRPWKLWPEGIMPVTGVPKGRVRRPLPVDDGGLRGRTEWFAGRVDRADETFRREENKLFTDCAGVPFDVYLMRRISILKRRMDVAHMHGAFVHLLPIPRKPDKGGLPDSEASHHASVPEEEATREEKAAFRARIRDAVALAYAPMTPERVKERLHRPADRATGDGAAKKEPLQSAKEEIASLGIEATIEAILGIERTRDLRERLEHIAWWTVDPDPEEEGPPPDNAMPTYPCDVDANKRQHPWSDRDRLWSIVDLGYFDAVDDPVAERMKGLVELVFEALDVEDSAGSGEKPHRSPEKIVALIDIFSRLGSHELAIGWIAGAFDLLTKQELEAFRDFRLEDGQGRHYRRSFVWLRLAEELRLRLFAEEPASDRYVASAPALGSLVRISLLLEREARRKIKKLREEALKKAIEEAGKAAPPDAGTEAPSIVAGPGAESEPTLPIHARRGYFGRKARHHADTLARYHHMHDKERAAMLVLEATMLRLLSNSRRDLEYALGYLGHADRIQLGMARDSRLRLETSFERGKVNRCLALAYMSEIEEEIDAARKEERQPEDWIASARQAVKDFFAASVTDLDLIRNDELSKEPYWAIILRMQEVSAGQVGENLKKRLAAAIPSLKKTSRRSGTRQRISPPKTLKREGPAPEAP